MTHRLVIVGGGNMGAALAGGLLATGSLTPAELAIAEAVPARRAELESIHPGVLVAGDVPAAEGAVIAVKPQDVASAVAAAVGAGARRVLSIAAGVRLRTLEAAAGPGVAVVRAMPNTPALVGQGAAAIAGGHEANDDDLAWAEDVLGAVGSVERVDEAQLDAVTALSGSGPAYVFLVAEALTAAAVDLGLPADLAARLTTQLLVGAAALLAARGDPATLRANVTSPGGTTAAGLAVLEARDVRDAFAAAVRAAAARSAELGV